MSIIALDLTSFVVSLALSSTALLSRFHRPCSEVDLEGWWKTTSVHLKFPSPSRTLKDSYYMIYAFQVVACIFLTF